MSANTSRVGLYKPGGGSTGLILPDEIADIDKINGNMDLIDAALGILVVTSTTRPAVPFNGQGVYESDTRNTMVYSSAVTRWLTVGIPNAASAALRDAIYPAPVAGMQVFRTDIGGGMLQVYTGTTWRMSSSGLVPIIPATAQVTTTGLSISSSGAITFAAASQLIVDTFMNSDFDSYLLKVRITAFTSNTQLRAELRAAGATVSTATYDYSLLFANTATPGSAVTTAAALTVLNAVVPMAKAKLDLDISAAAVTTESTTIDGRVTIFDSTGVAPLVGSMFAVERTLAARDGIRISPLVGTITGKAWLYGTTSI